MPQVFDTHTHYIPPEVAKNTAFFKVRWSDLAQQIETMDAHGIEKSLLLYPTSDAHLNMGGWANVCRVYNAGIAAAVKQYPSRFIGAGILPLDEPSKLLDEMKRCEEELGFKVFSLPSSCEGKYLDDEIFAPIFEHAQKKGLLIHVHPQIINPIGEERVKDPLLSPVLEYVFDVSMCIGKLMMEGTFLKFPDVPFIFAHYGGVLPFVKERFDNTYAMLRKREFVRDLGKTPGEYFQNLYFDTSGSKSAASLLCALEVTDPSHILWGSDYPANQNIQDSLDVVARSPLSDVQQSQIFELNFATLLRH